MTPLPRSLPQWLFVTSQQGFNCWDRHTCYPLFLPSPQVGKQDRCCYVNSSLATTLSSHTHSDWMAYATLCCLGSFEHLNCQVVTCENVLTSGDHFCRLPSWHHRSLKQCSTASINKAYYICHFVCLEFLEARNALSYIKHIFKDPETRCRDIALLQEYSWVWLLWKSGRIISARPHMVKAWSSTLLLSLSPAIHYSATVTWQLH